MRPSWLIFWALFSGLACGANVDKESSASTSTGGGGGGSGCQAAGGGGSAQFPATTTTPDCPMTPDAGTCTQQGQVCTWTTGNSSVTYTCEMVTDCSPMTYVLWSSPVVTGDGCAGSACCVACAHAKPDDPCDALGYQCPYHDTSGGFPPLMGLICLEHAWAGIPVCEN
jgi:hypothetical protein